MEALSREWDGASKQQRGQMKAFLGQGKRQKVEVHRFLGECNLEPVCSW